MDKNSSAYSDLKIFHHGDRLKALEAGECTAPIYIRLKPTNVCNHNCYYCTYAAGNSVNRGDVSFKDSIPLGKMKEIIEDISEIGVRAVTFSGGGEPLAYPHIKMAAEEMIEKGIDISLITNGQLLRGSIADIFLLAKWLRISFDSPNKDTYAKMRGISDTALGEVCRNIENFCKAKKDTCEVGINYVIGAQNFSTIYEMTEMVKGLGVNNIKFSALVGLQESKENIKNKQVVIEQINKAKQVLEDKSFRIVSNYEKEIEIPEYTTRQFDYCYTKELVTVIAADCKVYYCHQRAYDNKAIVGDISEKSFKEVWFSDEATQKMKELKPRCDCKNPCVYEDRNRLLNQYFEMDRKHINFI